MPVSEPPATGLPATGPGDGTGNGHDAGTWSVAIAGLGYVGLPTALRTRHMTPGGRRREALTPAG